MDSLVFFHLRSSSSSTTTRTTRTNKNKNKNKKATTHCIQSRDNANLNFIRAVDLSMELRGQSAIQLIVQLAVQPTVPVAVQTSVQLSLSSTINLTQCVGTLTFNPTRQFYAYIKSTAWRQIELCQMTYRLNVD